jgi:hypothetical protein
MRQTLGNIYSVADKITRKYFDQVKKQKNLLHKLETVTISNLPTMEKWTEWNQQWKQWNDAENAGSFWRSLELSDDDEIFRNALEISKHLNKLKPWITLSNLIEGENFEQKITDIVNSYKNYVMLVE